MKRTKGKKKDDCLLRGLVGSFLCPSRQDISQIRATLQHWNLKYGAKFSAKLECNSGHWVVMGEARTPEAAEAFDFWQGRALGYMDALGVRA